MSKEAGGDCGLTWDDTTIRDLLTVERLGSYLQAT